jgi:hypothetical protein
MKCRQLPIIKTICHNWDFYRQVQKALKWRHSVHDPKRLAESSPPENESIEIHCAWVTEAFTPSNIEGLIESLKQLGWDNPASSSGGTANLVDWVQQRQRLGDGSSWINGGMIVPKTNDFDLIPGSRNAKLPSGVKYARLSMHHITSCLTLVTIQFVFDSSVSRSLNESLTASYRTYVRYSRARFRIKRASFIGVVDQKKLSLKNKLNKIHTSLHSWFNENMPGYFANSKVTALPTTDLITSVVYKQPKEGAFHSVDEYISALFSHSFELWKQTDDNRLELRWFHEDKGTFVALFGNLEELKSLVNSGEEGSTEFLLNDFHDRFNITMGLWATHYLLISLEKQLSIIRDRALSRESGTGKAMRNLNFIRHQFSSISLDTQAVCSDLASVIVSKGARFYEGMDFIESSQNKADAPSLLDLMRQQDSMRIERLIKLERYVNQAIISSGSITSAITNLRVQRNIFWLTLFVGALTLISVLEIDLSSLFKQLMDFVRSFK